eukprot:CFRG4912T1
MTFLDIHDTVKDGDTVVFFRTRDYMQFVQIHSGKSTSNRSGTFKHKDIIGKPYGAKVQANMGFCHILRPTPELWTYALPHRTQILYTPDISMITAKLCLKPGDIVVESGTGSGSLSHAMIRTIAPSGHLYTFDFHEERVQKARTDFKNHRVDHLVTSESRDVMGTGFGLTDVADAVFLDLPGPWEAIMAAKQALKPEGGRVCSFSPCIEQVQRTCKTLRDAGFVELETLETLQKPHYTNEFALPICNFNSVTVHEEKSDDIPMSPKVKNEGPDGKDDNSETVVTPSDNDTVESATTGDPIQNAENSPKETLKEMFAREDAGVKFFKKAFTESVPVVHTRVMDKLAGHTGYLTFARIYDTTTVANGTQETSTSPLTGEEYAQECENDRTTMET